MTAGKLCEQGTATRSWPLAAGNVEIIEFLRREITQIHNFPPCSFRNSLWVAFCRNHEVFLIGDEAEFVAWDLLVGVELQTILRFAWHQKDRDGQMIRIELG